VGLDVPQILVGVDAVQQAPELGLQGLHGAESLSHLGLVGPHLSGPGRVAVVRVVVFEPAIQGVGGVPGGDVEPLLVGVEQRVVPILAGLALQARQLGVHHLGRDDLRTFVEAADPGQALGDPADPGPGRVGAVAAGVFHVGEQTLELLHVRRVQVVAGRKKRRLHRGRRLGEGAGQRGQGLHRELAVVITPDATAGRVPTQIQKRHGPAAVAGLDLVHLQRQHRDLISRIGQAPGVGLQGLLHLGLLGRAQRWLKGRVQKPGPTFVGLEIEDVAAPPDLHLDDVVAQG
jgi:hypothetical protein